MSELLSASSLLLAVVGIFYGLWYNDISIASSTKLAKYAADNEKTIKELRSVLWVKSIPLATASLSVAIVYAPDTWTIIIMACNRAMQLGWVIFSNYDAIRTSFVLVELFAVALAAINIKQMMKIISLIRNRIT